LTPKKICYFRLWIERSFRFIVRHHAQPAESDTALPIRSVCLTNAGTAVETVIPMAKLLPPSGKAITLAFPHYI